MVSQGREDEQRIGCVLNSDFAALIYPTFAFRKELLSAGIKSPTTAPQVARRPGQGTISFRLSKMYYAKSHDSYPPSNLY